MCTFAFYNWCDELVSCLNVYECQSNFVFVKPTAAKCWFSIFVITKYHIGAANYYFSLLIHHFVYKMPENKNCFNFPQTKLTSLNLVLFDQNQT